MGRRSKKRLTKRKNRKLSHTSRTKKPTSPPKSPPPKPSPTHSTTDTTQTPPTREIYHSTPEIITKPRSTTPKPPQPPTLPPTHTSTQSSQTSATTPPWTSRITSTLNSLLLFLLIFTLPTNLSLHFFEDQAHIHGILVDYLIPKLYLSDLIIFAIFIVWFFTSLPRINLAKSLKTIRPRNIFSYSLTAWLIAALTLSSLIAPKPIAALWYLLKLCQLYLLYLWLKQHLTSLNLLTKPLVITATFQSTIAILQWIQKSSIMGYLFLGESSLKTTSHIAKTVISGEIRPLPYGTTPHPNVLAGFLSLSLVILFLNFTRKPITLDFSSWKQRLQYTLNFTTTSLFTLVTVTAILLTQSASAIFTLLLGVILIIPRLPKNIKILLAATLVSISFIIIGNLDPKDPSITRRAALNTISLQMLSSKPALGIGLNNFTAVLHEYQAIPGTTRFFQPTHNIYLLWLAETGLAGTFLLGAIILRKLNLQSWELWHPKRVEKKLKLLNWTLLTPLALVLIIGLIDHYPLTLQTGQLLLILTMALSTAPLENTPS